MVGSNCEEEFSEGTHSGFIAIIIFKYKWWFRDADGLVKSKSVWTLELSYLKHKTQHFVEGFIIKKLNTILLKNFKTCLGQNCTNNIGKLYEITMTRENNEPLDL